MTRCSDTSRAREEPLVATASRVSRWLLVEQCGPWGPPALPTARMPPELAARLRSEAARLGARLLLLRHPHGVECPPGRQVLVAESRPGAERLLHRGFADDGELLAADLPSPVGPAEGWASLDGPLLLVCTHGRHDVCCAVRGRPVALALSARWPDRTWECSHVGGDRFAANVVVLPSGDYLGRVEPEDAVATVQRLLDGTVPVPVHRGRSSLPLPVQAAQWFARRATGRDGVEDLRPAAQQAEGDDAWRVRLAGADGRPGLDVRVSYERTGRPELLTCAALTAQPTPVWRCELVPAGDTGPAPTSGTGPEAPC